MDTCICMTESLCCPPETITTLSIGHTPLQNKKLKKKKKEKENLSLPQAPPSSLPTSSSLLLFSHLVVSDSLRPHGLQPARLLCPWNFPGKNTGVSCHFLFQGILLTQG